MKTKLILLTLLWGVFSFSNQAYAVTINKAFLTSGEELTILNTTDGQMAFTKQEATHIENLKKRTLIIMKQENGLAYRGAGTPIDKRHILTVNHLIPKDGNNYYFTEENGTPYDCIVIKQDPEHDLAILEIDKNAPDLIEPMTFATNINLGDTVYTIGHPLSGLYSLTEGNILKINEKAYNGIESVKLDIKIHDGNSGGFVINNQGELVGMISSGSQVINWGYMIGKDDIQHFLKEG